MGPCILRDNNEKQQKTKQNAVVHVISTQCVNGSRVILLDSELELKLKPTWSFKNSKSNFPEVATEGQVHKTVRELNDHISLIKSNKKSKVHFVDFIDRSKIKTESSINIAVKQECSEESTTESNNNTIKPLLLVEDRSIKTSDDKTIKITKPVLMPGIIKKVSFVPIKPKPTLGDLINIKKSPFIPIKPKETVQIEGKPFKLTLTESRLVHLKPFVDCGNISKVQDKQQVFNKKIPLKRMIQLHPLNIHKLKSSQENKKNQLSNILTTATKNSLIIDLRQTNGNELAFPVAIKSSDPEDINLRNLNPMDESGEQILGL